MPASYRWLAALSSCIFNIKYRARRQNLDADGLSRRPHRVQEKNAVSHKKYQCIEKFRCHLMSSVKDVDPPPCRHNHWNLSEAYSVNARWFVFFWPRTVSCHVSSCHPCHLWRGSKQWPSDDTVQSTWPHADTKGRGKPISLLEAC